MYKIEKRPSKKLLYEEKLSGLYNTIGGVLSTKEEYTKEERDRIEDQVNTFSKIKVALAPVFGRGASKEIIQASVDDAKANLLPRIDSLIGAVDW